MHTYPQSVIAVNVKRIIKENALKQGAIGEKIGHNPKRFSAMLNGRLQIKVEDIPRLAKVLGVTPNDLFSGEK